jgi:hypothetical protein
MKVDLMGINLVVMLVEKWVQWLVEMTVEKLEEK